MKMTEKTKEVLEYLQAQNGRVSTKQISEALGRNIRSITPNLTILTKAELVTKEKVKEEVNGESVDLTYVTLTEEGQVAVADEE